MDGKEIDFKHKKSIKKTSTKTKDIDINKILIS